MTVVEIDTIRRDFSTGPSPLSVRRLAEFVHDLAESLPPQSRVGDLIEACDEYARKMLKTLKESNEPGCEEQIKHLESQLGI